MKISRQRLLPSSFSTRREFLRLYLVWPARKLQQAQSRRTELLSALHQDIREPTEGVAMEWLTLGRHLEGIPDTPDRAGYWIGLLGVRSWIERHPEEGMKELLRTPVEDILLILGETRD